MSQKGKRTRLGVIHVTGIAVCVLFLLVFLAIILSAYMGSGSRLSAAVSEKSAKKEANARTKGATPNVNAPADSTSAEPQRIAAPNDSNEAPYGQGIIEVTSHFADIRLEPSKDSELLNAAMKGDLFEAHGEDDGWYRIVITSGDWRYIPKTEARLVETEPDFTTPYEKMRALYRALAESEMRAIADADRAIPPAVNWAANVDYQRVLDDKYKLRTLHKYGVQPIFYNQVNLLGSRLDWLHGEK